MKTRKKYTWWDSFKSHPFTTKLFNWEFWPFHIRYALIYWYWLYLSIRARSIFFFSNANPRIPFGGMMGESKQAISDQLPKHVSPAGFRISPGTLPDQVIAKMNQIRLSFPIIIKPDKGERGIGVERIKNQTDLKNYLEKNNVELQVQEYISYPKELGILYYRLPGKQKGDIISVTVKKFPTITGDGESTFHELLFYNKRTRLHMDKWKIKYGDKLKSVPGKGEEILLSVIGNHSRGATFLDGKDMVDEKLISIFDTLVDSIDEFNIGRFDIRFQTLDKLKENQQFKVVELNGVGAEPTHIYQPGYSIFSFYKDIARFWKIIYKIGAINKSRGYPYTSFKDGLHIIREYKRQLRQTTKPMTRP